MKLTEKLNDIMEGSISYGVDLDGGYPVTGINFTSAKKLKTREERTKALHKALKVIAKSKWAIKKELEKRPHEISDYVVEDFESDGNANDGTILETWVVGS